MHLQKLNNRLPQETGGQGPCLLLLHFWGLSEGRGLGALPFCVQVLHTFPTWPQRPFPAMLHGADGRALPVKFTELYERVQVHTSGVMTETSFEPRCF